MNYYDSNRRPVTWTSLWPVLVLAGLLVGFGWRFLGAGSLFGYSATPRAVTARGDLAESEKSTIDLFREASPSVVHIQTKENVRRQGVFNLNLTEIPKGTGSGFVWDKNGHVVTNYHVIQDADTVTVRLADHSTWPATIIGQAPDKDLAVLRIQAPAGRLRPILIGESANLDVGQSAYAIGNPFGLDQTLTTGVISALGREIESVNRRPIRGVIQTDAAINPGNSGGPLLDSAGRLIGVNTQIFSASGSFTGIGFAIPVETVNWVVTDLITHGKIVRPALGVEIYNDRLGKERLGIEGLLVVSVLPGSGAERAGLKPPWYDSEYQIHFDVITEINGAAITKFRDLYAALENHDVGDSVTVTVVRDNKEKREVQVVLQALE